MQPANKIRHLTFHTTLDLPTILLISATANRIDADWPLVPSFAFEQGEHVAYTTQLWYAQTGLLFHELDLEN